MRRARWALTALAPLALASLSIATAGALTGGARGEQYREAEVYGRRVVEAINSNDPDLRLATVRAVFAESTIRERGEAELVALLERLGREMGTLEFHHAEGSALRTGQSVRHSMHVFVRSTGEKRWKDLQFMLEATPPHKIANLVFIASVAEPVNLPNGSITDPRTIEWLDGYVDKLVADEDLSGAILIAERGRPVFERYFGHADSARTVPCTERTRFNLGSGNKMFTALAAALLVEEGRLSFDATLDQFFPEFAERAWAGKATVGHLLSHTSGLGEYWTAETDEPLRKVRTLREVLPFVERAGIRFAPGEGAEYSNSNFILAGLVIEAVTGEDYHDFVRRRIFEPCGMANTDAYPRDGSVPDLATPLSGTPRAWRGAPHGRRGTSAGGGFSTARDILRFSNRLVEGGIVPPAVLARMTSSKTEGIAAAELDYGYGFILESGASGAASFGHGGIARGVNFEYRYFPESGIALIAFSNQDNGAYDSLRKTATLLITGDR